MATTDNAIIVQRPLAELAWTLRERYGLNRGMTKKNFMAWYDTGEIQLSMVYENLFVATRNALGKATLKESGEGYDFVEIINGDRYVLGDMKTTVLQKDRGKSRRYNVKNIKNKIGNVYVIGWNFITNEANYFVIPPDENGGHSKTVYAITMKNKPGYKNGWYADNYMYDTWEDMVMAY